MQSFNVRNVNHAFPLEINMLKAHGKLQPSRAGQVLEFPYPVATTYTNPMERVLFNKSRMANPFFHFVEGLWIINGSRDVEFLDLFNTQMRQYSEDGISFWGAYGHRLRHKAGFDQIEVAVENLTKDKTDRRVVLAMWDPTNDLFGGKKDHPCNTHIYLKVRDEALHMTVCCRSNDLLYGKLGANVVHMSMLQEYLASRIGVCTGPYTQFSDSLHVYVDVPVWAAVKDTNYVPDDPYDTDYPELLVRPYPMFHNTDHRTWHEDLIQFMIDPMDTVEYTSPFFRDVAQPMALVWEAHKKARNGLQYAKQIAATDWRLACTNWLTAKEVN